MTLDEKMLKQLIATFKVELEEKLQVITDGLVALEGQKRINKKKIIEEIFRAAHNIKGSARSLGINAVGDIAHQIESLFTDIKTKTKSISEAIINSCFMGVDAMRLAMQSFCDGTPLAFEPSEILTKLQQGEATPLEAAEINEVETHDEYESIRVSVRQIDDVSALVEEMQINKIIIEDHYSKLKQLASMTQKMSPDASKIVQEMNKKMHNAVNHLSSIANALQEEVRLLRLVPASNLLRHLGRSVRDLAHELNKPIDFEIHGDHVKMDKIILEGLKDPIIHLLRNAIDHGIEDPELRQELGKPETGKITLDVIDEGSQILIKITDDGGGIDSNKIADYARKKNILPENELLNLDEEGLLQLIFRPEFSTKDIISKISGRGVGLDVVKTNLAHLKGTVSFATEPGKGTTFLLRFPLTLASDIGLMVKANQQVFAIPISAIHIVLNLKSSDIRDVEGVQAIIVDQKTIPLTTLSTVLGLPQNQHVLNEKLFAVVLGGVAFLVEEIIGEREIVIKPIQAPLNMIPCIAGGTLSSSGEVIIVLNTSDLIRQATHANADRIKLQTVESAEIEKHHILLVEDSITTRTLEKNILESNNYNVTAVVDGKEAWDLLQKQRFSLVITDVEMPNMTGFELTEHIKQDSKLRQIPVIIVTSLDNAEHKKRGIEVGADAYIVKHDFESTDLLEMVAQLV